MLKVKKAVAHSLASVTRDNLSSKRVSCQWLDSDTLLFNFIEVVGGMSEQKSQLRKQWSEMAEASSIQAYSSESGLRCKKCGVVGGVKYNTVQLRSADEGQAAKWSCSNCKQTG